jgi:hypothetical protein
MVVIMMMTLRRKRKKTRRQKKMMILPNIRTMLGGFQDGGYREEAESVSPIVKSWRDAGDTPCKQNHREEAKL